MIKDFLVSFKDNVSEKAKNPFLGTYLLVWLIRNWELLFSIFYFDESYKLEDKINFVKNYYENNEFLIGLLINIFWTFLVLIVTYLLLNISRYIVNTSEKRISPWVYKITDSKSIVLKEQYDLIRNDRDTIQERFEKERENRFNLEKRNKELEDLIANSSSSIENDKVKIIYNKLDEAGEIEVFQSIGRKINNGEYLEHNVKTSIELGLIEYVDSHFTGNSKKYKLTNLGREVLDYIRYN